MKTKSDNNSSSLVVPKQVLQLFLAIAVSAAIIVVFVDLVLLPVILFALNNSDSFTSLVKYFSIAGLALLILYGIVYRMVMLRRRGYSPGSIAMHFVSRPGRYILVFLAILLMCALLVAFLYIIFHGNHQLLHKIIN